MAGGIVRDCELTDSVETLDVDEEAGGLGLGLGRGRGAVFEEAPCMTRQRRNFQLLVVDDNLYAIGGDDDCTIEMFDEYSNSWLLVSSFPQYRKNFAATSVGKRIVVSGGQDRRKGGLRSIDVFDVSCGEWNMVSGISEAAEKKVKSASTSSSGQVKDKAKGREVTRVHGLGGFKHSKAVSEAIAKGKVKVKNGSGAGCCTGEAVVQETLAMPVQEYSQGFVFGQVASLSFRHLTW